MGKIFVIDKRWKYDTIILGIILILQFFVESAFRQKEDGIDGSQGFL